MKYFITSIQFTKEDGQLAIVKAVRSCPDSEYETTKTATVEYLTNQATKENNWTEPLVEPAVFEEITVTRWNSLMTSNLDGDLYPITFVEDFTIYTEANEDPIP